MVSWKKIYASAVLALASTLPQVAMSASLISASAIGLGGVNNDPSVCVARIGIRYRADTNDANNFDWVYFEARDGSGTAFRTDDDAHRPGFTRTTNFYVPLAGQTGPFTINIYEADAGRQPQALLTSFPLDAATLQAHAPCAATVPSGTGTAGLVQDFMDRRAAASAAAQPDLIPMIRDDRTSISANLAGASFAARSERPVWANLTWRSSSGAASMKDNYMLASVGTHIELSDRFWLGALAQIDRFSYSASGLKGSGSGWLAGPYVLGQFGDAPAFFEARVLAGRSNNSVDDGSGPSDFGTSRRLARFKVEGHLPAGDITFVPNMTLLHVQDRYGDFVDASGTPVPANRITRNSASFGLALEGGFGGPSSNSTWRAELNGVRSTTKSSVGGAQSSNTLRAEIGLRHRDQLGGLLDLSLSFEGAPKSSDRAVAVGLRYEIQF